MQNSQALVSDSFHSGASRGFGNSGSAKTPKQMFEAYVPGIVKELKANPQGTLKLEPRRHGGTTTWKTAARIVNGQSVRLVVQRRSNRIDLAVHLNGRVIPLPHAYLVEVAGEGFQVVQ